MVEERKVKGTEDGERRKRREGREEGEIDGRKKKVGGKGERPPTPTPYPPPFPSNNEFCGDLQA